MSFVRDHVAYIVAVIMMSVLVFCIHTKWLNYVAAAVLGLGAAEIDKRWQEERDTKERKS